MLTLDQLDRLAPRDANSFATTAKGEIIVWLCLRCGGVLMSCPDPCCVDELHHNEIAQPFRCREFSLHRDDPDILEAHYASLADVYAEAEGLAIYEAIMRRWCEGVRR